MDQRGEITRALRVLVDVTHRNHKGSRSTTSTQLSVPATRLENGPSCAFYVLRSIHLGVGQALFLVWAPDKFLLPCRGCGGESGDFAAVAKQYPGDKHSSKHCTPSTHCTLTTKGRVGKDRGYITKGYNGRGF